MITLQIIEKNLSEITMYENNPRNNKQAVEPVANSIREFGFRVPIIIDKNGVIIAGHTRYKAAQLLQLEKVPCIVADDLSEEQVRMFRLADNKVAEYALWDISKLSEELEKITGYNMEAFGFDPMQGVELQDYSAPEPADDEENETKDSQPEMIQCPNCGEWFEV